MVDWGRECKTRGFATVDSLAIQVVVGKGGGGFFWVGTADRGRLAENIVYRREGACRKLGWWDVGIDLEMCGGVGKLWQ